MYGIILHYPIMYSNQLHLLHYTPSHNTLLQYNQLHYTVHYIKLHYTTLHNTVQHLTTFHYVALHPYPGNTEFL